jgi:hypothetical protein
MLNPATLWTAWAVWLTFGAFVITPLFDDVSLGPPILVIIAIGYPAYVLAFAQTWRYSWSLPLSFGVMHIWYNAMGLGVLEATEVAPEIANLILLAAALACFAVPMAVARIKLRVGSGPPMTPTALSRSQAFLWVVLPGTVVVFLGMSISALEFVQANAFRDFCISSATGMSRDEIESRIAIHNRRRFLKERSEGRLELSSHGRGCLISFQSGKAVVERLLPRSGFWWMLRGRPNAALEGAFEKGLPGAD